ncbi:MAG: DUF2286 domain-containing protein [Sulfolobales archaeon]|nr:DUF2286 domain-containing protein [Sulfolobales archaeon]
MRTLVAHVEFGELKARKLVEVSVEEAVRNVLFEVLALWDPARSDLVVTKEKLLDIKPELARYADVDVYIISYDIEWRNESVVDRRFFIVMKDMGDVSDKVVEELTALSREALLEFEKEVKAL